MKVLGISFTGLHDSGIAYVEDGKLVFAIEEERITRIKHDNGFPARSISYLFDKFNLRPENLDFVVFSWPSPMKSAIDEINHLFKVSFGKEMFPYMLKGIVEKLWIKGGVRKFMNMFGNSRFLFLPHHLAHAISGFALSGMDNATIVVVDGKGSFEATSIWHGSNGKIYPVKIIRYPDSLGLLYAKFTTYLGFVPLSDEWKVMGLSAYGERMLDFSPFISFDRFPYRIHYKNLDPHNIFKVDTIAKILGHTPNTDKVHIDKFYRDVAFSLQRNVEKAMLNVVKMGFALTGNRNLVMAGGVVLNSRANGVIVEELNPEKIFIQPAAGDDGTAIGAAYYPYLLFEGRLPVSEMKSAYLGSWFEPDEIEEVLKRYKLKYRRMRNREKEIAQLLAEGNIIGLFQGRMEFGPRALGNRSILADPRKEEMKDRVNNSVKFREFWRPFAPSIMEEYYYEFFDVSHPSPFMILTFKVKENQRRRIPAVVHVDGTSRPQSVNKEVNQRYWNILNEFYRITGVPVLLNTSFNLKGEPIVNTPTDAIRTFYSSGLDYLVLEDFIIGKR